MHVTTLLKTTHKTMVFGGFALVLLACGNALASRAGELLATSFSKQPHSSTDVMSTTVEGDESWVLSRSDMPDPKTKQPANPKNAESGTQQDSPSIPSESASIGATNPQPVQAPANSPATSVSDSISASLVFVNKVRADAGISALKLDAVLNSYALNHAKNLANQCKLYHQDISVIIGKKDATGKKIMAVGENVAYSSSSLTQALNALKNSTGHYKNMVGNYTRVGFGVVKSGAAACKGHIYTVQVFAKS